MRARLVLLTALAAACGACTRADRKLPAAPRPNYLSGVPYLAQSHLLDTAGTPDAQHVVIQAPAPLDSVARFYRHRLPPLGWSIMSDTHDSTHATLYLERGGLPMWIQIEGHGPVSLVSFIAAGAGTAAKPAQPHPR